MFAHFPCTGVFMWIYIRWDFSTVELAGGIINEFNLLVEAYWRILKVGEDVDLFW